MLRIGIMLFDDIEILDFAGPYEVLAGVTDEDGRPLFHVCTIAPEREVTCRGGLRVLAAHTFAAPPPLDMLIVPGGPGARGPAATIAPLAALVRGLAADCQYLASVCTGAFLLAEAGLLAGRRCTTHSGQRAGFAQRYPDAILVSERVVDDGDLITAAGVSSGVDLALHLVARFGSPALAAAERRRIEWPE